MHFVTLFVLFVGGVLGAAGLIIAKKPDAKQLIDKLTPYQGYCGALMFIWGIWDIITTLRFLSLLGAGGRGVIAWVLMLIVSLTELCLGFLLGFGLITKYALSKNAQAMEKGEQIRAKIIPFQSTLGIISILLAILWLLYALHII